MSREEAFRGELESVVTAWDAHERSMGFPPVVDFNIGARGEASSASDRTTTKRHLDAIDVPGAPPTVRANAQAHLAYLQEMAEGAGSTPLERYLQQTQGVGLGVLSADWLASQRRAAKDRLIDMGVNWGESALSSLRADEGAVLSSQEAVDMIVHEADRALPRVRALCQADASIDVKVELVREDAFWSYWTDGGCNSVRVRINERNATLTETLVRQFALHEILGHGLQGCVVA